MAHRAVIGDVVLSDLQGQIMGLEDELARALLSALSAWDQDNAGSLPHRGERGAF